MQIQATKTDKASQMFMEGMKRQKEEPYLF